MAVTHPRTVRRSPALLALGFMLCAVCCAAGAAPTDTLLIIRQAGDQFAGVIDIMRRELGDDFAIHEFTIEKKPVNFNKPRNISSMALAFSDEIQALEKTMDRVRPAVVVPFDNIPLSIYYLYCSLLPDSVRAIPSVTLFGAYIDEIVSYMRNAGGILYEVPVVTSVVNLRYLMGHDLNRIGVIYREFMASKVDANRVYCEKEEIALVGYPLPNDAGSYSSDIKKGLKHLIDHEKVDAVWIVNDSRLLTPTLATKAWSRVLKRRGVPVIVGVESLVTPDFHYGTYAVLPDNRSLAIQAADMIYAIRANGWTVPERAIEPPLAIYEIITYDNRKMTIPVAEEKLQEVDRVVR
jgi:hypothetical protein